MYSIISRVLEVAAVICLVGILACSAPPQIVLNPPKDLQAAERGRTLVKGLAACGYCHAEKADPDSLLVGGRVQHDKYGEVIAPNITPAHSGIGVWNVQQVMGALRSSIDRDGKPLSLEVHQGFEWMSDDDTLAIVSYLSTISPVENSVEKPLQRRSISFIDRNTVGLFDRRRAVKGYVPPIIERYQGEYGRYLVDHVARCQSCHSSPETLLTSAEYLAGGKTISNGEEGKLIPGITQSTIDGIGAWSEEALVHYLQSGETPDSRIVDSSFCPVSFYRNAPLIDLRAIAKYLLTVPTAG